jgi:maleylpyruvate isomerase
LSFALHGYYRSSCSWRVRIALHWKGLDWEAIPVHLVQDGGQQHGSDHRALNPMRQVPVLVDGEAVLGQSVAILEYLEEVYPDPPLLSGDAVERAYTRQMVEVINSGIQPIQNLSVMQHLGKTYGLERPQTLAWSAHWIARGFDALETLAFQRSGRYCCGNQVSFADVCLVPQVYNARRFDVDMSAYPTLLRIEEELSQIPSFSETSPERQPDAPQ